MKASAAQATTPPPSGIAPVDPPAGGFGIDGDLQANTPQADVGDWLFLAGGSGTAVLDSLGVPLHSASTFHETDPFGTSGADGIFTGGLKWYHDPNTWEWTMGKCSSKTDINNVLIHLSTDATGHLWSMVSADRLSTSGDSYIDFEFLQNTLTKNSDGTFSSEGPNGGRTVNDLLLSLAFTGGGKVADFFVWTWQSDGAGGYEYVEMTDMLSGGSVLAALNATSVPVPYGAFDQTTYDPNAFAEGAVDLTELLSILNPCMSLAVKTIMVKTKASQSSNATIEDFIDPIQQTLTIGPSANAGPDQVECSSGESTIFNLNGTANQGIFPIASSTWTVVEGEANIADAAALNTTVEVFSATATLQLIVEQENGCTASDDIILSVTTLPDCQITGPDTDLCPDSITMFSAPEGLESYTWSVTGNGTIVGPADQSTVEVQSGDECGMPFQLSLIVMANDCVNSCETAYMVQDTVPPLLTIPGNLVLECPADTGTNSTGVATAIDDCGFVEVTFQDNVANPCGGTVIIERLWTATDSCGNQVSEIQMIVVEDNSPPVLVVPPNATLECPTVPSTDITGVATATDTCGTAMVSFNDSRQDLCGGSYILTRTWTAIDECGNTTSIDQTIMVEDKTAPVLTVPENLTLECPADTGTNATGIATATDTCSAVEVGYSDSIEETCGGAFVLSRTWTAVDECGNTISAVQTITVEDNTAPELTLPENLTLECPADTGTNATGVATATDTCSAVEVGYSDSIEETCGGADVLSRTWTAIDECGNTVSAVQTITVEDNTAPELTLPENLTLECPADTGTNATGVASAIDLCSAVQVSYEDTMETAQACGGTVVIKRNWTAIDECGNTTSATQTITVEDKTPPTLTLPADLVLECTDDTGTTATGMATAIDACGDTTITFQDDIEELCGGSKIIRRIWTAVDECGNTSTATQTLTVEDNTPPILEVPADVLMDCTSSTKPDVTGSATATDLCSEVSVSYSDQVETLCGASRIITRTWTALDECGNTVSADQVITVEDRTAPIISCIVAATYTQGGYQGGGTPWDILRENYLRLFPNGLTVGHYDPSNGNDYPNGIHWEGNSEGLATLHSFLAGGGTSRALEQDLLNPMDEDAKIGELAHQNATLTLNIAFNTDGVIGIGPNTFSSVIYTKEGDSLSGFAVQEILDTANWALSGQGLPEGYSYGKMNHLVTRLNEAFHGGHPSSWALEHLSTPVVLVSCASEVPAPIPNQIHATDECGSGVTIIHGGDVITDQTCENRFVITRTWIAVDDCGNEATCTQTIVVDDNTAPVLAGDVELMVPGDQPWEFVPPTTLDNCSSDVVLVVSDTTTNLTSDTVLVVTRTWEATDACGNSSQFAQTVTIGDSMAVQQQFDEGTDGWSGMTGTVEQSLVYMPSGGMGGGFVMVQNGEGMTDLAWMAPAGFIEDGLRFYSGALAFALNLEGELSPDATLTIILEGTSGTLSMTLSLNGVIPSDWNQWLLDLQEQAGWINADTGEPARQAELVMALSTLTNLSIVVHGAEGITSGSLDSITLAPPTMAPDSGWVLELRRLASGRLELRWPALAIGHGLQETDSLSSANWKSVAQPPAQNDGMNHVEIDTGSRIKFYRLKRSDTL